MSPPPPPSRGNRNEEDTRGDLIEPKIKSAGWGEVEGSRIRREVPLTEEYDAKGKKRRNTLYSDFVLVHKGKRLAAVEAKKESLSHAEGVRQAQEYARRMQCRIAYSTNGHEIFQIDMEQPANNGLVDDYLSPAALWALTYDEAEEAYTEIWREQFLAIPFEDRGNLWKPRYYQANAIENALDAIAKGKDRILLTLATGTGKTAISFQIAWKLFNSRWSLSASKNPSQAKRRPRILFLADRNFLANQAFNSFAPFGEDALIRIDPTEIKKRGTVPKNGSVFFTIFQTFMTDANSEGEIEDEDNDIAETATPNYWGYPPDFFDLVIIDECHRGGANSESSWRDILDYFSPAVQIGLTATPKRDDNVDTYDYFDDPVYQYTLREGIDDGYLTPFKVVKIIGNMDEYTYTQGDGVVIEGEPEEGRTYYEKDFNRLIVIPAREQKRVHDWMDRFNHNEKTLVFCATQAHAGMVRDFINQYAGQNGWTNNNDYCVRVTAKDAAAGEKDLRIFQDNEKTIPTILTTSRKLSTGVDARNIRNIVLMRECKNMIEFKQIIGRGTRTFDGKEFFTVYDFVKAHHNFNDDEWDGEPLPPDPPSGGNTGGDGGPIIDGPDLPPLDPSDDPDDPAPSEKIVIRLSDEKTREIQHVASTMYWGPDGKLITAREFLEKLFGDLPQFFGNELELREIWRKPDTREKLLVDLAQAGYDTEQLDIMKTLIDAKNSDVYDVLAYVAYASETMTREERVAQAQPLIGEIYSNNKQQAFINFVLERYVDDGVAELSVEKMKHLLELKYNTMRDAADELGSAADIREVFVGFQGLLYGDEDRTET